MTVFIQEVLYPFPLFYKRHNVSTTPSLSPSLFDTPTISPQHERIPPSPAADEHAQQIYVYGLAVLKLQTLSPMLYAQGS